MSNASDALEKLRHSQLTDASLDSGKPMEIHISVDEAKNTFTIQDFGIGMTEEEAISNLGTIARSGSKAFLENLEGDTGAASTKDKIIGQFGVGFYSAVSQTYLSTSIEDERKHQECSPCLCLVLFLVHGRIRN